MNNYIYVNMVTLEWFPNNSPAKTLSSHIAKTTFSYGIDMKTKRPLIGPGEHVTRPHVPAAG